MYNKLMATSKTHKISTSTKTAKSKSIKTSPSSKPHFRNPLKFTLGALAIALIVVATFLLTLRSGAPSDYIVETNAFFAPFEFYEGHQIVGVDVEIIDRVAKKLNKTIEIKDAEFDVIIDNVAAGKIADAGAAGLTITPARAEKVNFSIPYYTSVQYVIYAKSATPELQNGHILWDTLAGHTLGTQTGSTGYLFTADEIDSGILKDTATTLKGFESHQLAADAISAHLVDYAIADQLAAQFITDKNPALAAAPLYYRGVTAAEDYPAEESYAIAVNKNRPELLEAFNSVLAEMLTPGPDDTTEIDRLVLKYMGF